ncbi:MAG: glycoside hydrolase family 2 TIM barrel-domain containing protein [Victivallales bacterium]|nr:glycoside hydrolase family 2 TIM barrel-domain containing protein [Victivallales bacterium]
MKMLNGIWDFSFTLKGEYPDFKSKRIVPSCFDTDGLLFGQRGFGWYRTNIMIGGMVKLSCRGGLHYSILWDGREVGNSVLPWSREEFVFNAGEEGKHTLIIKTDNLVGKKGDIFKENYDFYGYGGIYDQVTIKRLEDGMIDRINVFPLDHTTGLIKISLDVFGHTPEKLAISFDGEKYDNIPFASEFDIKVPNFRLWTPEHPQLHTITVNSVSVNFGIRTLDWSGNRLKLNGKPVKLIGYNRHETHPEFGAAIPDSLTASDLLRIKEQGCNFIRGAHYPQKESMLELADKLGILIWEESLAWGNKADDLANLEFIRAQIQQAELMVRKSLNHPSVIMWGFLNEHESDSQAGLELVKKLYGVIRGLDISRPITFASNKPETDICFDFVDIIALNVYPGWYDGDECTENSSGRIRPVLQKYASRFTDKPLIISEIGFAALLGDRSGLRWSEEYQAECVKIVFETILDDDRFSGLALWQFCDAKSFTAIQNFTQRPRGYNNKGVLTEFRVPKSAWKVISDVISKHSCQQKSKS